MTTTAESQTAEVVEQRDPEALVDLVLQRVASGKGKVSFAEALADVMEGVTQAVQAQPEAVKPLVITEEHKAALSKIADLYGKVAPAKPRLLTHEEQRQIVEERATIDTILALLKTRKDTSIRETLANHLDKVAERDNLVEPGTEKDRNGHYCLKQDEPVEGTTVKISRSVSEPKPQISDALVHELWEKGVLTREEYLSVTTLPDVPRVFDPEKASKAVKKNPALLAKIHLATTVGNSTTTIKVNPNRG